jgi:hypothetical protein
MADFRNPQQHPGQVQQLIRRGCLSLQYCLQLVVELLHRPIGLGTMRNRQTCARYEADSRELTTPLM